MYTVQSILCIQYIYIYICSAIASHLSYKDPYPRVLIGPISLCCPRAEREKRFGCYRAAARTLRCRSRVAVGYHIASLVPILVVVVGWAVHFSLHLFHRIRTLSGQENFPLQSWPTCCFRLPSSFAIAATEAVDMATYLFLHTVSSTSQNTHVLPDTYIFFPLQSGVACTLEAE